MLGMQSTETPQPTGRGRFQIRTRRISRIPRRVAASWLPHPRPGVRADWIGPGRRHDRPVLMLVSAPPRLALLRTADGWALCDAHDRLYEAAGADARRACLARGLELGAVCVRAGEEMCRRPSAPP